MTRSTRLSEGQRDKQHKSIQQPTSTQPLWQTPTPTLCAQRQHTFRALLGFAFRLMESESCSCRPLFSLQQRGRRCTTVQPLLLIARSPSSPGPAMLPVISSWALYSTCLLPPSTSTYLLLTPPTSSCLLLPFSAGPAPPPASPRSSLCLPHSSLPRCPSRNAPSQMLTPEQFTQPAATASSASTRLTTRTPSPASTTITRRRSRPSRRPTTF